jgi:hypothetical protein
MKTFHCTHCHQQVFFENSRCLHCGYPLAYLPDRREMAAVRVAPDGLVHTVGLGRHTYHRCANEGNGLCNWAIPSSDSHRLCTSCRLTRRAPVSLTDRPAMAKLEASKRRLIYTLLQLELPLTPRSHAAPQGLCFDFLADTKADGHRHRITTGHDNGVITINLAEADDVQRELERTRQAEPYRTLLGHFRHETGHYYWDSLIRGSEHLTQFRSLFGDERVSYGDALKRHYDKGPPTHWQERYISAYASAHPWEDWAECWAHFLHMLDALESAAASGLALAPSARNVPRLRPMHPGSVLDMRFDQLIERWVAVTSVMNSLNRSLGLPDSYPFVLSPSVLGKLRFIYRLLKAPRAELRPEGALPEAAPPAAPSAANRSTPPWLAATGIAATLIALGVAASKQGKD